MQEGAGSGAGVGASVLEQLAGRDGRERFALGVAAPFICSRVSLSAESVTSRGDERWARI
jgi:hypothetical protein